uniref:Si:ch1073-44g3.1 n=1 Tax=Oncorhynchus kisutch TaxID=8019 RepID=A0A8C7HBN7_ONCKI
MMHQVTSSSNDYCMSGIAEECQHPTSHFDLCSSQSNKFYPSPPPPTLQLPRPNLPTLPQESSKKKKGSVVKSGRRGRPSGTTKSAGYRTSTGRPLGTTKAAGFKTSPGRPLGTTKAAGYKVSPGRPPGSIKTLARLKKLEYGSCDVAPFPYTLMQKRGLREPTGKMEETNE